jgi:hypothetical protein
MARILLSLLPSDLAHWLSAYARVQKLTRSKALTQILWEKRLAQQARAKGTRKRRLSLPGHGPAQPDSSARQLIFPI